MGGMDSICVGYLPQGHTGHLGFVPGLDSTQFEIASLGQNARFSGVLIQYKSCYLIRQPGDSTSILM